MRQWKVAVLGAAVVALVGCAGKVEYLRPTANPTPGSNSVTIPKSRDAVWATAVPELGKRFFVINNLDKSSGLINVSYSGDPERYVDCGRITSYVKNARGERNYNFAGSAGHQTYETMQGGLLFAIDRRMALEGRVNLIFEELGPTQTRVTATTRYVMTRQRTVRQAGNAIPQSMTDTLNFNTGGRATFSGDPNQAAECVATGALEREILSAVH